MHFEVCYRERKRREGDREGGEEMEIVKGRREEKKEERLRMMGLYLCPDGILHVV